MKVYLNRDIGSFKPVNGASNYYFNATDDFFKFGFPSVRLHDQDFPRP